jgi:hypothetical protein
VTGLPQVSAVQLIDLTAKSPAQYRIRLREPAEVTTIVLHQMGFAWRDDNPMWAKVRAHYAVQQAGAVVALHDPAVRMRYGSGVANRYCVSIEHEGNYADDGRWYKPDRFGRHVLADHPELVRSSRVLISSLVERFPSITTIMAHRHIQRGKPLCCGPELWREVGEWARQELGLVEGAVLPGGAPLPDRWRGVPVVL